MEKNHRSRSISRSALLLRSCRYYYYYYYYYFEEKRREKNIRDPNAWIDRRFIRPLADLTASFPVPAATTGEDKNTGHSSLPTRELSEERISLIKFVSTVRLKIDIFGGNESEVKIYPPRLIQILNEKDEFKFYFTYIMRLILLILYYIYTYILINDLTRRRN